MKQAIVIFKRDDLILFFLNSYKSNALYCFNLAIVGKKNTKLWKKQKKF